MAIKYQTPKYFAGFSCLGADCPDTCCRDWEVKLDRQHYELLQHRLVDDDELSELFNKYIELNNSPVSGDHDFAFIRMQQNGYCAMLNDQRLCRIHASYGVEPLGNVCTMFPRVIARCDNVIEMSGAMSCPEVVKRCLQADNILGITRFKAADLPRSQGYPISRELAASPEDYYAQYFTLVRQAMMQLVANEEYKFDTRLYALANMAHKLSGFYHRYCGKPDKTLLDSMLTNVTEDTTLQKLQNYIQDYDVDAPIAMIVIHSVLQIKYQQSADDNLAHIYQSIMSSAGDEAGNDAAKLWEKFHIACAQLSSTELHGIDKALTHYLVSSLYREWFVSMPDPFTYVQMLLVRIALLRFMLIMHLTTEKRSLTDGGKLDFEALMVYVIYNFARSIDQNLEFLKVVYNALAEQEMMSFDYSPAFIRL